MKFSVIKSIKFIWNIFETIISSRHETAFSTSRTASEAENYGNNKQIEFIAEFPPDQTSVEANTNPIEIRQQKPLQVHDSSYSEKFTD